MENGYSPSELLIGQKIQTSLPIVGDQLKARMPNVNKVRKKEERIRDRMKRGSTICWIPIVDSGR